MGMLKSLKIAEEFMVYTYNKVENNKMIENVRN